MIAVLILLFAIGIILKKQRIDSNVIVLLLFLFTNGFALFGGESELGISIKYADAGLALIFFIVLLAVSKKKFKLPKGFIVNWFCLFLLLIVCVDLIINKENISSTLKCYRYFAVLLLYYCQELFSPADVKKSIEKVFFITLFFSVVLIIEFLLGIKISNADRMGSFDPFGNFSGRGAFGSTFALFAISLLVSDYIKVKKQIKFICLGVFVLVYIFSATRSTLITCGICILLTYFLTHKVQLKKLILLSAISLLAVISIYAIPAISNRFSDKDYMEIDGKSVGTFGFRILLTAERLDYILRDPQYVFFGLGGKHEDDAQKDPIFLIGTGENTDPLQLETPDIAWAVLFMRFGIVGTMLYLLVIFDLLRKTFKDKSNLSQSLFVYLLLNLVLLSFTDSFLSRGMFLCFPIIVYYYIKYEKTTTRNDCDAVV